MRELLKLLRAGRGGGGGELMLMSWLCPSGLINHCDPIPEQDRTGKGGTRPAFVCFCDWIPAAVEQGRAAFEPAPVLI